MAGTNGQTTRPRQFRGVGLSMTAAGRRVDLSDERALKTIDKRPLPWQLRSYNFYDPMSPLCIGEVWFAGRYIAEAMSRIRIFPAIQPAPEDDPISLSAPDQLERLLPEDRPSDAEIELLLAATRRLTNTHGGQADIMRGAGLNNFLVGESYLIGRTDADTTEEEWEIHSVEALELDSSGKALALKEYPEQPRDLMIPLANATVIRIWRRHPRFPELPDAAMGAALTYCEDLRALTHMIRAAARSRMPSGILGIPQNASEGPLPDDEDEGDPAEGATKDKLTESLLLHFSEPVGHPDDAAAFTPFILRLEAEDLKAVQQWDFSRDIDRLAVELRQESRQSFAATVDLPADVMSGKAGLNDWCVDDETEILTDHGWVTHDQLEAGDVVLTLNHETGISQWQPVERIARFDRVDAPMVAIEGRYHSSLTTPNHRWPVLRNTGDTRAASRQRVWRTSETLNDSDFLITGAVSETPTEPKWSDAFVEAVAWFWTEGSALRRPGRSNPKVAIYQSHTANPDNVARITRCLTALYGPAHDGPMPSSRRGPLDPVPRWRAARAGSKTVFSLNVAAARPILAVAPDRLVSLDWVRTLTAAQLLLFIDISVRGDGTILAGGTLTLSQGDPARLAAFEFAAILAGFSVTRYTTTHGSPGVVGDHAQYYVSLRRRTVFGPRRSRGNRTTRLYTGTVWCPTTANGSWLARRHGSVWFTGNSAWNVDEETFKMHLAPHAELIVDALTAGYLWPTISPTIERPRRFRLWYDASELIHHPNKSENAKVAHERITISDSVFRSALGFDDADMPDDEERARRLDEARVLRPTSSSAGATAGGDRTAPAAQGGEDAAGAEVTAAGRVERGTLGYRLAMIEQGLIDRLLAAADSELRQALDRAGSRIVAAGRKRTAGESVRQLIAAHPKHELASRLGQTLLAAIGLTTDSVLDDAFDSLEDRWLTWTERAQRAALAAIIEEGRAISEEDDEELAARMDEDRRAGWAALSAALVATATSRLFAPDQPHALGERDSSLLVQPGAVRDALSIAGGGPRPGGASEIAVSGAGRGGLLSGETVSAMFRAAAVEELGWVWVYGDPSSRSMPFEPHMELDGLTFPSWEDPALANSAEFPETEFFYPGDHLGCQCTFARDGVAADEGDEE